MRLDSQLCHLCLLSVSVWLTLSERQNSAIRMDMRRLTARPLLTVLEIFRSLGQTHQLCSFARSFVGLLRRRNAAASMCKLRVADGNSGKKKCS